MRRPMRPHREVCRLCVMPRKERRASEETFAVVDALARDPEQPRYGLEIIAETGVASGTLYPILIRLERRGLVKGNWAVDSDPSRGPRRRYYRLTPGGVEYAVRLRREREPDASEFRRPALGVA